MTKKAKIIVAAFSAFLVLVIAGLAVGLVLVAQQVQMTNSVSVTYIANNVDCTVEVNAVHWLGAVGKTHYIKQDTDTAKLVNIINDDG